MQNAFNVNSPVLTYHLDAMKDLVSKTEEGKYRLSTMGEGAMALMERVEEPPKPVTPERSPRGRRKLTLAQVGTVFLGICLLIDGLYLTSQSTVQTTYPLPYEYAVYSTPFEVNGVTYNTSIVITTPVPQELNGLGGAIPGPIFVRVNQPQSLTNGVYNLTFRYVAYSASEDKYIPKEVNYKGNLMPQQFGRDGFNFNVYPTIPPSEGIGLSTTQQPIPRDLVFSFCTNAAWPLPQSLFSIEASTPLSQFGYIERFPYKDTGNLLLFAAILALISPLALTVVQHSRRYP